MLQILLVIVASLLLVDVGLQLYSAFDRRRSQNYILKYQRELDRYYNYMEKLGYNVGQASSFLYKYKSLKQLENANKELCDSIKKYKL
jgi:hypothetical protein